MEINKSNINGLIKTALGTDWEPDIDNNAIRILNKCDSTTEQLYLLGAASYIEQTRDKHHGECSGQSIPIIGCVITYNDISYEGLWFVCPWGGWLSGMGAGPTACALIPQLKFPDVNYHHDFGLFYGASDGGGAPWHFKCAIEIDPEVTHKNRRDKDEYRDQIVDYDVVRVYGEVHDYLSWFQLIIDRDDEEILKHCPFDEGEVDD
jgi:hypothetical protein